MNNWNAIKRFYAAWDRSIQQTSRDQWAMDPYEWENGMLRMTPIEEALWADIRNNDAVFYPQYPVAGCFLDFANPAAKVAIECDGAAYHTDKEKDARRDARLARLGWRVYRITGRDCKTESDPETGNPGIAFRFVRDICNTHSLRRGSTGVQQDREWLDMAESFAEPIMRSMRIRHEIRQMLRAA